MQVMMAMLGRPPEHALLGRALGQEGEHELERAAGRVGAMREIAMIAGADGEHPQPIERDAERDRLPGDAGPDRRDAGEMHQHERDGGRIDDVAVIVVVGVARSAAARGGHGFIRCSLGAIERHERGSPGGAFQWTAACAFTARPQSQPALTEQRLRFQAFILEAFIPWRRSRGHW